MPRSRSLFGDVSDRMRCSIQSLKPLAGCEFSGCSVVGSASGRPDSVVGVSVFSRLPVLSTRWPKSEGADAQSIDEVSTNVIAPPHRCLIIILNAAVTCSSQRFISRRLADSDWRVQADANDRTSRERDVLAIGRRDRAARTDHCAEKSALDTADDASHDAANAGTGCGDGAFLSQPLALEDLGGGSADLAFASIDIELVERQRQRSVAIDSAGLVDITHDATND